MRKQSYGGLSVPYDWGMIGSGAGQRSDRITYAHWTWKMRAQLEKGRYILKSTAR